MYESHQRFLCDVAGYDSGGGSTSLELHTKWANSLRCPVLKLDGRDDLSSNARIIVEKYRTVCTHTI